MIHEKQQTIAQSPFWHSLTLRMFAMIILPLTLLSMVIAIGSVIAHQREMRLYLSEDAWRIATLASSGEAEDD